MRIPFRLPDVRDLRAQCANADDGDLTVTVALMDSRFRPVLHSLSPNLAPIQLFSPPARVDFICVPAKSDGICADSAIYALRRRRMLSEKRPPGHPEGDWVIAALEQGGIGHPFSAETGLEVDQALPVAPLGARNAAIGGSLCGGRSDAP